MNINEFRQALADHRIDPNTVSFDDIRLDRYRIRKTTIAGRSSSESGGEYFVQGFPL